MRNLFSEVLNMSLTASLVILFVLLARLFLKRSPKIFSYALWSVVLFRLLCPVALTAPVSLLTVVQPTVQEAAGNTSTVSFLPAVQAPAADATAIPVENQPVPVPQSEETSSRLSVTPMFVAALAWIAVAVGMMCYHLLQYLVLKQKLDSAIPLNKNIYISEKIDTALVTGIWKPRIYLPSHLGPQEQGYVLAHEQHHIRRGDHIFKLLAFLALCIHWFNPLVWIAFVLAGKDMEMSCDEAVLKKLGPDIRADYSASLLRLAAHRKAVPGMPLAFGEGDTKGRILNMANWKKPAKWLVILCVVVCLCIILVCALNPGTEDSPVLTSMEHSTDTSLGVGDLYFTYPAGLTSETREVENWTFADQLRVLRGEPSRRQWNNFFSKNGTDFGGVVDFVLPDDREIHLDELPLPAEWTGLDSVCEDSAYPYSEGEYTLIKDGNAYIEAHLYTYSGRGYFLWFYCDQGDPAEKQTILESVTLGSDSKIVTRAKQDNPLSLGRMNLTIPKGYGYLRSGRVKLEITKPVNGREADVIGGITVRQNPGLPIGEGSDLLAWVEAMGIAPDQPGLSLDITDEPEFGDISLSLTDSSQGIPVIEEQHYFFIAGDVVYDLWFNSLNMNTKAQKQILESVWIKEASTYPAEITQTAPSPVTSVQIETLPEGFSYHTDQEGQIVFTQEGTTVGGVRSYPIPAEIYDPLDDGFFWLEQMGIPDYEDPNLIYTGGITSGDNGWHAEFADSVDENNCTVYRQHNFQVVGDVLYDIWFDNMLLDTMTVFHLSDCIRLPAAQTQAPVKGEDVIVDIDLGYEKAKEVMDAVGEGSCHIVSVQKNDGNEGPSGYERNFLYHEGNCLYTSQLLTDGENRTEAGAYYNRYALLIYEDAFFSNDGHSGTPGEILWTKTEPVDPVAPWLGNRLWVKSMVTYLGAVTDEDGTCYQFRYEKPFDEGAEYAPNYLVNFWFDPSGSFRFVEILVNQGTGHGFTLTESIVSMDPDTVAAEIDAEYRNAIG